MQKIGNVVSKGMVNSVTKSGLASLLMLTVIIYFDNLLLSDAKLFVNETLRLVLVSIIGFITYLSCLIILKVEEIMWIVRIFFNKSNKPTT